MTIQEQNQGARLPRFYIVLTLSKPENTRPIFDFYYHKLEPHPFEIRWLIGQQCGEPDPKGTRKCNEMIGLVPDGEWFSTVADDTLAHPALLKRIGEIIRARPDLGAIIFSGVRDAEGEILHATPENMVPCRVCGSQVIWNKGFLGEKRYDFQKHDKLCDGELIREMYQAHPEKFMLVDEPLTYFNSLEWWDEAGYSDTPMPDHTEETNSLRRRNLNSRNAWEIDRLEKRTAHLEQVVESAEQWQRSWFRRAFRRWHAVRKNSDQSGAA